MKILIIEDNRPFQILAEEALNPISKTQLASSLSEAREALKNQEFDFIVLDIHLPDGDGMSFFNELNGHEIHRQIPVLFLTGKNETPFKVAAFTMGAIDYMTKPFDPIELRVRVESHLKRRASGSHGLVIGALRLDSTKFIAEINNGSDWQRIQLTTTEFRVLHMLAERPDVIFSRDQLLTGAWGDSVHVSDRNVDSHISSLRKKLAPYSEALQAVRGAGYRLSKDSLTKKAA